MASPSREPIQLIEQLNASGFTCDICHKPELPRKIVPVCHLIDTVKPVCVCVKVMYYKVPGYYNAERFLLVN